MQCFVFSLQLALILTTFHRVVVDRCCQLLKLTLLNCNIKEKPVLWYKHQLRRPLGQGVYCLTLCENFPFVLPTDNAKD